MDHMQLVEEGNIEILKEIHDFIVNTMPYRLISHPSTGIMVISHSDPLEKTNTRIGETTATYCEVEVDGNTGYGCIPGNDPERAKYAAMIDALIWSNHPALAEINPLLDKIKNELYCKWKNKLSVLCV